MKKLAANESLIKKTPETADPMIRAPSLSEEDLEIT
jgi:hypothetical protein